MCELFCLSSRLPTRATFSLDSFASHGAPPGGMIDGWGIAFYDGLDVRLHKEPEPAGDSVWFAFIKQQRVASRLIVSHIRRATMGGISLANTQPFTRESGGRMHVFAHNGNLKGIEDRYAAAKHRFRPVGETIRRLPFACSPSAFRRSGMPVQYPRSIRDSTSSLYSQRNYASSGRRTFFMQMATPSSRMGIDASKPTGRSRRRAYGYCAGSVPSIEMDCRIRAQHSAASRRA